MQKIHIIHENPEWTAPLLAALGDLDPPRDLWPGIAATIQAPVPTGSAETKVIAFPGARAGAAEPERAASVRRFAFSTPQLVAASLALVAASSLTTWAAGPGLGTQMSAESAVPVNGAVTMAADVVPPAELADELNQLEQILIEARGQLDPNTVRVLERNLGVIEQAIQDSHRALQQDPGNEFLAEHLDRVYERKLNYLRDAARVAEWSS